jgi:hypothetical protein
MPQVGRHVSTYCPSWYLSAKTPFLSISMEITLGFITVMDKSDTSCCDLSTRKTRSRAYKVPGTMKNFLQ